MAYNKTTWVSGETPLSAQNFNNMEEGISASYSGENELTFTSGDTETEPSKSASVELLESGETLKSILTKMSNMFKNVRYLLKMMGTTDISGLSSEKTVTGALAQLNGNLGNIYSNTNTIDSVYQTSSLVSKITLPAGTYIVMIKASADKAVNDAVINIGISLGANVEYNGLNQALGTMRNGGGLHAVGIVKLSGESIVSTYSYGYYNGAYKITHSLQAIKIK